MVAFSPATTHFKLCQKWLPASFVTEAFRLMDRGGSSEAPIKQRFEFCLVFDKLKHMKPEER